MTYLICLAVSGHIVVPHASENDAILTALQLALEFRRDRLPLRMSLVDGGDHNFRPVPFHESQTRVV